MRVWESYWRREGFVGISCWTRFSLSLSFSSDWTSSLRWSNINALNHFADRLSSCVIDHSLSFTLGNPGLPRSLSALRTDHLFDSSFSQTRSHSYNYNPSQTTNDRKMHFLTTTFTLLSLTTSIRVLAAPLTFTDIERRWSAGESDVRPLLSTPSTTTIKQPQCNLPTSNHI